MERLTLGRMQNPVRGFLHGTAALATVVGLSLLLERAWGNTAALVGSLIFTLSMLAMYIVSSLYHSVPWSDRWKSRLQRIDHSMIFVMVAGTFTPIAIAALDGVALGVALALVWGIAAGGIILKTVLPAARTRFSITLQLAMGWLAVIWLPAIIDRLGATAVVFIALGGLCYTLGVVIFTTKRPKLFPRTFSYHELFHVLVIAGSAFHYLAVFWYAVPATA
jgi:hemolysin III